VHRVRSAALVVVAAALLGLATGCQAAAPDRATTLSGSPAPTASASASASQERTGGGTLDAAQVSSALPVVTDLPTGWTTDPAKTALGESAEDDDDTVAPPSCRAVFDRLDRKGAPAATAEASAGFTKGGLGPFLGVKISSFASDVPAGTLSAVARALDQCPTFSVVDDKDGAVTFTATPLSFPRLGDETLAFRLSATLDNTPFTSDLVVVRVGRTTVTVTQIGLSATGTDPAAGEQAARTAVRKLPA